MKRLAVWLTAITFATASALSSLQPAQGLNLKGGASPLLTEQVAVGPLVRVAVPMHMGPLKSNGRLRHPDTTIQGNCGTAYLYLTRVNGHETRATYGFQNLLNVAVGYTAGADFVNEDSGRILQDRASGGLFFRRSFERSVTKDTGSGVVAVYAHLHAIGTLYDCYSSSLYDIIFVY